MIETISNTSNLSVVWQYVGPLLGVGFGYLISNKVWNRQRQWEMKRDAVLDAIRAYADLEYALINLNSLLSTPKESVTDKTNAELSAAAKYFRSSRYLFRRAHLIADLAVGGQFSNDMSAYFLLTGTVSKDMTSQKSLLDRGKNEKLALAGKDVILSARQALGIKDAGDLPQFDDSN
jgi:hypothetical protein